MLLLVKNYHMYCEGIIISSVEFLFNVTEDDFLCLVFPLLCFVVLKVIQFTYYLLRNGNVYITSFYYVQIIYKSKNEET